jgi:uncharacterized metal-binding protein YceD (DUF177 family)
LKSLKEFGIAYIGLKQGKHDYTFKINDAFFESFEHSEIEQGNLTVDLTLDKQSTLLNLSFRTAGTVNVNCDRCTDPLTIDVEGEHKLIVKFGDENYEQTDEIVVLSSAEHELNTAHYIYEFINLIVPSKKLHPEGECNEEMIARLDEYTGNYEDDDSDNSSSDPRWDALKNLDLD